ncbi:MAG: phosphoribosylpyrophosphate synthetase [bacterium]
MADYNTLTDALADLEKRGFTHDFGLKEEHRETGAALPPEEFEIVEFYRFEGMSDPDNNSVIYAIQSRTGLKGVLIDAYGVYSDTPKGEMISKLRISR